MAGILLRTVLFHAKMRFTREEMTYTEFPFPREKICIPYCEIRKFERKHQEDSEGIKNYVQIILKNRMKIKISGTEYAGVRAAEWLESECNAFLAESVFLPERRKELLGVKFFADAGNRETENDAENGSENSGNENGVKNSGERENEDADDEDVLEEVNLSERITYVEQPFDSGWTRVEQFAPFEVYRYGKFSWKSFSGTLFTCIFWNSIVSVFLLGLFGVIPGEMPTGWGWWGMFFFLTPFEIIGVLMIFAFLRELLAGYTRIFWAFDRNEIRNRTVFCGLGITKKWDVTSAQKIQFCGEPDACGIVFLDADEEELCCTDEFTLRDARWLVSRFRQIRSL